MYLITMYSIPLYLITAPPTLKPHLLHSTSKPTFATRFFFVNDEAAQRVFRRPLLVSKPAKNLWPTLPHK